MKAQQLQYIKHLPQNDRYAYRVGYALESLKAEIDKGGEYPDLEYRIAKSYGVSQRDLREAYDESCNITHFPLTYL